MTKNNSFNEQADPSLASSALSPGAKNVYLALLLAFTLGNFGLHKFYLGRKIEGLVYLLLCWTLLPWVFSLIDLFFIPGQLRIEEAQAQLILMAKPQQLSRDLKTLNQINQTSRQLEIVLKIIFGVLAAWIIYVLADGYWYKYKRHQPVSAELIKN